LNFWKKTEDIIDFVSGSTPLCATPKKCLGPKLFFQINILQKNIFQLLAQILKLWLPETHVPRKLGVKQKIGSIQGDKKLLGQFF
jgi:hypothetical protein